VGGCAAAAPVPQPAELPNLTQDQGFDIRWALVQEPGRVSAVGEVESRAPVLVRVTVALYGVDADGRVVRTATSTAQTGFTPGPMPFSVSLAPTGREAQFLVRIFSHVPLGLRN
jgi:hypothetical protein